MSKQNYPAILVTSSTNKECVPLTLTRRTGIAQCFSYASSLSIQIPSFLWSWLSSNSESVAWRQSSFWVILKSFCDTFRLPLFHFLFPQLLKLRLDGSWTLSFYLVWLLIYFIFSTFLSLRATSWIISPVLAFNSQSISFRGIWLLSNVSTEF